MTPKFSDMSEALVLGTLSERDEKILRAFMLAHDPNNLTEAELEKQFREMAHVMRVEALSSRASETSS